MQKAKVAIIGSGNIGMNLLYKILKSPYLECVCVAGRNKASKNLMEAEQLGVCVSAESIHAITSRIHDIDIVFDASNAEAHISHSRILQNSNVKIIDLTPSRLGKLCVPCINGNECLNTKEVNLITCGGQSMLPIANAISSIVQMNYVEVVSTIPACSAGIGTRQNIDEYITTTQRALSAFSHADKVKAMLVLNPAEPPIIMRNTLYAVLKNEIPLEKISKVIMDMEKNVKKYVPGYKVITLPTYIQKNRIAVSVQVQGSGDFLPDYAGNLDIITCAGIEMAEQYALHKYVQERNTIENI